MPFNFPAPLPARFQDGLSYPLNLTADNRNYFTRISFIRYKPALAFAETIGNIVKNVDDLFLSGLSKFAELYTEEQYDQFTNPTKNLPFSGITNMGAPIGNHISLPIPKKINEMNMMNWSEISLTGTILGAARSMAFGNGPSAAASATTTALQFGSTILGVQINPYILQYFQRPSFREFSFTWTLAPRNRKESEQINKIINQIKAAQAPRKAAGGLLMEYPDLAIVNFHPHKSDDEFQINLKPCVIVGVNVDYTPAGPSYINGTAAPTMVNLTIHLKETKLWWSEEWGGEVGTATEQPDGIDPLYGPAGLPGA